jgi:hypothetical protein
MLASLENWNNAATSLRPLDVARVFATQNMSKQLLVVANGCLNLFEAGYPKLAKEAADSVPRSEFGSSQEYYVWAQFRAYFLKSSLKGDTKQKRSEAERKFISAERACARSNRRLRFYWRYPDRENPLYRVILSRARGLISEVLGNFSESTLEHILDFSRPGGGIAIGTNKRDFVTLPFKLGQETQLVCTEECTPYARMLVETSPHWLKLHASVDWANKVVHVPYEKTLSNRIGFVPKDATTMRTIAVEPHLNMCLQLGTHEYICRRLRAVGVDLRDQSANQRAAKHGAARWQDADPIVTLDLSSASDSISRGLVERLLPTTWFEFLDALRSKNYKLGRGEPVEFQKWSSMGNGYTFSLESLLFWALAKACGSLSSSEGTLHVYGDDICLRRGTAALLIEILSYAGFKVNTEKSAVFGPFRESCGEDYWADDRVVPLYLREMAFLRPTDLYRLVNRVDPRFDNAGIVKLAYHAHRGRPIVMGLPTSDDTACWWTSLEKLKSLNMVRWNKFVQAWEQRVAIYRPYKVRVEPNAGYAAALLGDRKVVAEKWQVKSTLRQRGSWSLVRVVAG